MPAPLVRTVGENERLAAGMEKEGDYQYTVRFSEAYPEHFLPAAARLIQREFPNGLALAADSPNQGTRLLLQIRNVPQGADVYVTVESVRKDSSPAARARLIAADLTGAGEYRDVPAPVVGRCGEASVGMMKLEPMKDQEGRSLGIQQAVWEVVSSEPNALETFAFGIMVAFRSGAPAAGQAVVNTGYAPVSTVATASAVAPIPCFAPVGIMRNFFAIWPAP